MSPRELCQLDLPERSGWHAMPRFSLKASNSPQPAAPARCDLAHTEAGDRTLHEGDKDDQGT